MRWTKESLARLTVRDGFRLRSENMTRLEVFSDTAFAFAMTMLVISVDSVPKNHNEMMLALKSVPAFALSFANIAFFWWAHRSWSQRYGLEDRVATWLTLTMIFAILVYVYPLKLIFSSLFNFLSGGWLPNEYEIRVYSDHSSLFVIYGVGYASLTLIIYLLYCHALNRSDYLALDQNELNQTRISKVSWAYHPLFGVASAIYAWLVPPPYGAFAGFIYVGLFLLIPLHKKMLRKRFNTTT